MSSKALSSLKMSESEKQEEKLFKPSNPSKSGVSEGRLPKVRGLWTSASENNEKEILNETRVSSERSSERKVSGRLSEGGENVPSLPRRYSPWMSSFP